MASSLHLAGSESPRARELPGRDYSLLKLSSRDQLKATGNARRAAEHTRVRQPQLDAYANPDRGDEFMPIDVVADLEAASGAPHITRTLAELAGYVLTPLPAAVRAGLPLPRVTGQALKETADVFSRLGQLQEDGVITGAESRTLDREIDEAVEKLLTLKLQVRAHVGGGS